VDVNVTENYLSRKCPHHCHPSHPEKMMSKPVTSAGWGDEPCPLSPQANPKKTWTKKKARYQHIWILLNHNICTELAKWLLVLLLHSAPHKWVREIPRFHSLHCKQKLVAPPQLPQKHTSLLVPASAVNLRPALWEQNSEIVFDLGIPTLGQLEGR